MRKKSVSPSMQLRKPCALPSDIPTENSKSIFRMISIISLFYSMWEIKTKYYQKTLPQTYRNIGVRDLQLPARLLTTFLQLEPGLDSND